MPDESVTPTPMWTSDEMPDAPMTCARARFLLAAYRPSGADATDPAFRDALEHVARCPECSAVMSAQRAFDEAVARRMQAVPVPAGLHDRILAGLSRRRPARPGRMGWAVAATVALAALGWWVASPTLRPEGVPTVAERPVGPRSPHLAPSGDHAVDGFLADYAMAPEMIVRTGDRSALDRFFAAHGVSLPWPAALDQRAQLVGGRVATVAGRPTAVALLAPVSGDGSPVALYGFDADRACAEVNGYWNATHRSHPTPCLHPQDGYVAGFWSEPAAGATPRARFYALVSKGGDDALGPLLHPDAVPLSERAVRPAVLIGFIFSF